MIDRLIDETSQFELHKCVVCNGFGTLKFGQVTCHGCKGNGFISIDKMTGLPVKDRQKDENTHSMD